MTSRELLKKADRLRIKEECFADDEQLLREVSRKFKSSSSKLNYSEMLNVYVEKSMIHADDANLSTFKIELEKPIAFSFLEDCISSKFDDYHTVDAGYSVIELAKLLKSKSVWWYGENDSFSVYDRNNLLQLKFYTQSGGWASGDIFLGITNKVSQNDFSRWISSNIHWQIVGSDSTFTFYQFNDS